MFEESDGAGVAVEHQILSDEAAGVSEAIRKLFVGGEQEQARSLRAVGANDDGPGFLQMRVSLCVEINGAGSPAHLVCFDAMDVGVRPNFAAPGALRQRDDAGK